MKIIITEQQFKKMINGIWDNKYLNQILDKISDEGIDSLTPEERQALEQISRGRDVEQKKPEKINKYSDNNDDDDGDLAYYGDDDENDDKENSNHIEGGSDSYDMFMNIFPNNLNISVENEDWNIKKVNGKDRTFIIVSNGDIKFSISVFFEDSEIIVKPQGGSSFGGKMPPDVMPRNVNSMSEFIDGYFMNKFIPTTIKRILKNG